MEVLAYLNGRTWTYTRGELIELKVLERGYIYIHPKARSPACASLAATAADATEVLTSKNRREVKLKNLAIGRIDGIRRCLDEGIICFEPRRTNELTSPLYSYTVRDSIQKIELLRPALGVFELSTCISYTRYDTISMRMRRRNSTSMLANLFISSYCCVSAQRVPF